MLDHSPIYTSNEADWLKVEGAAAVVPCGKRLIYRAIRDGHLRAARIGGRREIRIKRSWVSDWLEGLAGGGR